MKKKKISAYIMATLLTAGIASTQATAGILAKGNISLYKDGHTVRTITGQNPVEEEVLMVCNDKCLIKSTGISIIGAPGAELAIENDQEQFNLLLKNGQVDFVLSGTVGKMGFYTADRQYTSADVIYNASTSTPVRGYMQVTPTGDTRIGVYEGRLVFDTVEGAKTVGSNDYILLAQADIGAGEGAETAVGGETGTAAGTSAASTGTFAGINTTALAAGVAVAGAATYGVVEYLEDDDDDVNPSPNK